jgi:hypothetical protein
VLRCGSRQATKWRSADAPHGERQAGRCYDLFAVVRLKRCSGPRDSQLRPQKTQMHRCRGQDAPSSVVGRCAGVELHRRHGQTAGTRTCPRSERDGSRCSPAPTWPHHLPGTCCELASWATQTYEAPVFARFAARSAHRLSSRLDPSSLDNTPTALASGSLR